MVSSKRAEPSSKPPGAPARPSGAAATKPGLATTRERILKAGHELLLSKRGFSMGAVAERAGVSRQAVYLHFADRYALVEAVVDEARAAAGADGVLEAIESAPTAHAALGAFLAATVRLVETSGGLGLAVEAALAGDPKLAARWAKRRGRRAAIAAVAQRLTQEGGLLPGGDAAVVEGVLRAFTSAAVVTTLFETAPGGSLDGMLQRAIEAALLGLGPSPRRIKPRR